MRSLAAWVALFALGCVPALQRADLRQLQLRAAFDLGCPPASLSLYNFDGGNRELQNKGVLGCGQRAAYVERCESDLGSCTWARDDRLAPAGFSVATAPVAAPPGPTATRALVSGRPSPPAAMPSAREPIDLDIREWGRK